MSQLLLLRGLGSSSFTSLVFAIFSSIERGSSSPKGDIRHWLFFPGAGPRSFRRRPPGKAGRSPPSLLARNRPASSAAAREAIRERECQTRFSSRPEWRLAACLYAFHSKQAFVVSHVSSGARAAWPRTRSEEHTS